MNGYDFTGLKIPMRDFFRLPYDQRRITDDGPMVKSTSNGQPTFVRAIII